MALTLDDVARHLVGKSAADLSDGERSGVTEAHQMASDAVSAYVRGSTVPETVERSAVLRLAYLDFHSRLSRRPADGGQAGGAIPPGCGAGAVAGERGHVAAEPAQAPGRGVAS